MEAIANHRYQFGAFQLDERERRITCGSEIVHLTPKSFDVLLYLLKRAGKLTRKQDLLNAVWGEVVVT